MALEITVLVASYNGAATIGRLLEALCEQQAPGFRWDVVAVDNASTDTTSAVIDAYASRLPLQRLYVPDRGKNKALNAALKRAGGRLIVFTDDDIVPVPGWLHSLHQCAMEHPEFEVIGGPILPEWPSLPPLWIEENVPLAVAFAVSGAARGSGEASPHQVWGGNMVVARRAFDEGFRFAEEVGPSSGQYIMGSESDLNLRLARAGYRFWYCAEAPVRHIIRPHQFDRSWLLRRAFRYGRYQRASRDARGRRRERMILGVPTWCLRDVGYRLAIAAWSRLRHGAEKSFRDYWGLFESAGQLYQAAQERKTRGGD